MNASVLQCSIGLKCNDFSMMAADQTTTMLLFIMKDDTEKLYPLSDKLIMGVTGDPGDCLRLSEYVSKNLDLYRIRNGYELSTTSSVFLTRRLLADAVRTNYNYKVTMLMAGYDEDEGGQLFYLDALGTCQEVPYTATGCAGTLAVGVLDSLYSPTMSESEAYELMQLSVQEIQKRQFLNLTNFQVKVVNNTGTYSLPLICPQTFFKQD